ncbi:hypothetical protein [Aureibacter tunicatorum]|uniref:Zn ribbon nucleic-acid-binding protein n=1 Tax=Aureibacter tunicatorum TaxID=866807 RepID=A0AAE3XJX1_9BACT|nr:hypothetical protein [Aureibacter tunicatorum]MDR6237136.1 Zn ribbon nucleic-acid-binding protein [Aureibacter tunicatorum]BDD06128.1 hypothetical protein AUTU_36110 [Aureibacter tunicatorum]
MSNQNNPGLKCPQCDFNIKFTMESLLQLRAIECPSCGLTMDMNVPKGMKEHIQEIVLAEKMVHEAKNFQR